MDEQFYLQSASQVKSLSCPNRSRTHDFQRHVALDLAVFPGEVHLTHASSPVREQAWLGLRELTGIRDLPAEVGAWREVLQLGPPTAR